MLIHFFYSADLWLRPKSSSTSNGPEETPGVYNGGHLIGFARGNDGGCLHRSVGALVDLVANGTGVAPGFN